MQYNTLPRYAGRVKMDQWTRGVEVSSIIWPLPFGSWYVKGSGMGWFQVDFSRKVQMFRQKNWYFKEFNQISIQMCLKKCAIPTDLDFGVLSIKSMFLYCLCAKHSLNLI